jgi:hypothetical protein
MEWALHATIAHVKGDNRGRASRMDQTMEGLEANNPIPASQNMATAVAPLLCMLRH